MPLPLLDLAIYLSRLVRKGVSVLREEKVGFVHFKSQLPYGCRARYPRCEQICLVAATQHYGSQVRALLIGRRAV
jgi:hypothetical protein